jgi:hypothetical protein
MSEKKTRPLKLFNGRAIGVYKHNDPKWREAGPRAAHHAHAYIAAHSMADAVRLVSEYGARLSLSELQVYWNKGCWGDTMEGIIPERGIWIAIDRHGSPVIRLY